MTASCKILLVSDQKNPIREQVYSIISENEKLEETTPDEIKIEIDRISPDIIVLVKTKDDSDLDLVHYIQSESTVQVILFINDRQDFLLLRDMLRAGVSDYFVLPDELSQFADRFEMVTNVVKNQSNQETTTGQALKRGRGQVISFYSGKGGTGRTLISTAFAQTLQLESTSQVLLIDLNLQYGGAETFLGVNSHRSIVDLKPVIHELNENHIRNVSEKEEYSKLELLLSPRDAEIAEKLSDNDIARLIRSCRRTYDFVIIDLPSAMDPLTYTSLEESDLIYYVMNLDTPSIRIFKHVEDLFKRLGVDTEGRMELVINGKDRMNELNSNDMKNFIPTPIAAELRRDQKGVQAAVNKSEPLRKEVREKRLSPFAKDIRKWVLSRLK